MNIFISGATSAIAQAWARLYAAQGAGFYLLGRDANKLDIVKDDLLARGAREVRLHAVDMALVQDYGSIVAQLYSHWPMVDVALFAQGSLPDQRPQSNYFYGTSKAAVTTFAQGLRNHVFKRGVHVLTVKPGFVDTPMTASMEKGGPLWATPEQIAACIEKGLQKKKDVIYAPWFWRIIMLVIRHIPEIIFKRLGL